MLRRAIILASLLSCATLFSGCFQNTFEVAESELQIRYLPDTDEFLLLELEHGIDVGGQDPDPLAKSVAMLRDLAAGKRIYPASGDWFAQDIDDLRDKEKDLTEQEAADLIDFLACVQVEQHGLYVEEAETLSFYRLTHLKHGKRLLEILDHYFNAKSATDADSDLPSQACFPLFDEESREAYRKAIREGHAWLSIEAGAVVFDVPMTASSAARCLGKIASEERGKREQADAREMLDEASSLEVSGGHVRLQYGGASHPVMHFHYHSDKAASSERLIAALKKEQAEIGGSDSPAQAKAKLEPGTPKPK